MAKFDESPSLSFGGRYFEESILWVRPRGTGCLLGTEEADASQTLQNDTASGSLVL